MHYRSIRTVRNSFWQIICIVMVLSISSAGISLARWQDGTESTGTVTTGTLNAEFSQVQLEGDLPFLCQVDPQIDSDGKTLTINVDDAYPGCVIKIKYTITNSGSVPARYELEAADYDSDFVKVVNQFPDEVLEGNGGSAEGSLSLNVNTVPEGESYDLQMALRFKQAIPK